MLDKVAVGLDTRWGNQGVTRMGNSTLCVGSGVPFSRSALAISRGRSVGGRRHANGSFPVRAVRPPVGGCHDASGSAPCSCRAAA
jgi:hypothetical protein